MSNDGSRRISRRGLLRTAGAAAAGLGLHSLRAGSVAAADPPRVGESVLGMKFEPRDVVRIGIIGVGRRGMEHLIELLAIEKVEVRAVCDIAKGRVVEARARTRKAGQAEPAVYDNGERDFENLCRRDDLDLVYIATPWNWHVPMAVAALEGGKHAALEVPAANTIEECWALVQASERNRRHCVILENCCYGYNEMLVLGMVKAGLLGDLVHGEAAYIHDLRKILFENDSEGLWRRFEHLKRNGNLYPTHGLGPVAQYMGINRGDRFQRLVSLSSLERSLSRHRDKTPADDPRRQETYACGDMNTSIIRTELGRTILLQHDVVSPRPYDRINLISGTGGAFRDYPPRLFLDGQKDHRQWQTGKALKSYKQRFEHPLWKTTGKIAKKRGGHGGMDYIMNYRLVQCVREGLAPDMDVYDAAAWSAPAPLSEQSVEGGGAPVTFPDFTRGRWKEPR